MTLGLVPAGWARARLGDLGYTVCGQSPSSADVNSAGVGTAYVTGPDQWDGRSIRHDKWTTDPKRIAPEGSIFITVKGAGVGTIFPGAAVAIGRDIYAYCPTNLVDRDFISLAINHEIEGVKRQSVGLIPGLARAHIDEAEVFLPPLNEQRRIVAKIEELTARSRRAREALDAVPRLLDRLRQSVLAAAFSGRLTADWREQHPDVEPASELLERIRIERRRRWEEAELAKLRAKGKEPTDDRWKKKYKEPTPVDPTGLPELPEGWCWASLDELLGEPLSNGRSVRTLDGGFPVLRLSAIANGKIDPRQTKPGEWTRDEAERYIAQPGDFLVARGNGSLELVARGGVMPETDREAAFPDTMIRVRVVKSAYPAGLFPLVWHSRLCRRQLERAAKTTAGIYKVSQADLERIALPLPPVGEASLILSRVFNALWFLDSVFAALAAFDNELDAVEGGILARAFRGELVPQDPNDEPASVLLERIRAQRAAEEPKKRTRSSRPSRLRGSKSNRQDAKDAKEPTPTGFERFTPDNRAAEPQRLPYDDAPDTDNFLARALDHLRTHPGPHSRADLLTALDLDPDHWPTLRTALTTHPSITTTGAKRGTRYQLNQEEP